MRIRRELKGGFALPTVLIASVVMMIILVASVSSVVAVRTALKTQYYEQLAKAAGEAGVAYAKACLSKNGNVPLWTDAQPLTPATDCAGNIINSNCPDDPGCSVTINDNIRSSFSVMRPKTDANGRAVTIANSGYVELLRASNGAVWRTYRQPSVQSAVVPDLCSGAATTGLGWTNAVQSIPAVSIPGASSAATIAAASGAEAAGYMYFRKDFPVYEDGTYNASVLTPSAQDVADIYVDGTYIATATGSLANGSVNLTAGCHTVTVRLDNKTLQDRQSAMAAAIQRPDAAPIVFSDTTWRVESGAVVHFSSPDFDADPSVWTPVYGTDPAQAANAAWSSDAFARYITPNGNGCLSTCPPSSSGYIRDSKDFYLSASTDVQVSALCDDDCSVYIDGQTIIDSAPWSNISQQTVTLGPGRHRVAARLYNAGAAGNASAAAISVVDPATSTVLTRTDQTWQGATIWTSGLNATTADIQSYEKGFTPSPAEIATPTTFDYLVVGGGGGGGANSGGGGGAGGVIAAFDAIPTVATYTVTIGAGGAGTTGSTDAGSKGSNTVFGSNIAQGGGGGASRNGGTAATAGGSGGGGAGATVAARVPGAVGTAGQGYAGGNGVVADSGANATGGGGGGAGGPGVPGVSGGAAGNGGPGYITYMTGTRLAVAGGGGGSITVNGSTATSTDGGGNSTSMAALNGVANSGGGGGARTGNAAAGNGGSGLVIVRIKTGSMSVTTTGSPIVTNVTINGIAYTIYRFNASGSFKINSIN